MPAGDCSGPHSGPMFIFILGSRVMPIARTGVAEQLRSIGVTILGIILSLVPPALWVAWTETVLLIVVAVGAVSAASLVVLADSRTQDAEDRQAVAGVATRKILTEESIAEIHRIFPLTYHHSLIEKTRFHQAMEKIRQLLK